LGGYGAALCCAKITNVAPLAETFVKAQLAVAGSPLSDKVGVLVKPGVSVVLPSRAAFVVLLQSVVATLAAL
jgi:hypothetical protein